MSSAANPLPPGTGQGQAPNPQDEEFYASYVHSFSVISLIELMNRWGLCILCVLLIGALITSYYLQIKKIRAIHETVISIFAGMVVGLIIRLSPGHVIREMLVSASQRSWRAQLLG
jgi:sodium/hydrogen exchanger-like protein 6/7